MGDGCSENIAHQRKKRPCVTAERTLHNLVIILESTIVEELSDFGQTADSQRVWPGRGERAISQRLRMDHHARENNSGSKSGYILSSIRERLADKNGPHRLVFSMRPNAKYYQEKILGETQLFPYTTGSRYLGTWKDNKKSGFGTLVSVSGCKYEGEFNEDKRHGKGTYWVKEGGAYRKLYAGDWKWDKRDGFGILYYCDGGRYEGGWKEGKREGRGMMQYCNGDVYEGDWSDNGRSGIGILRLANGDRFEGHWMDDDKEGPGVYYFTATGKVYEGEWAGGIAKCGQIRDVEPEVAQQATVTPTSPSAAAGRGGGVPEPFAIPLLELDQPEHVLAEAVARVRQKRVRQQLRGQEEEEEAEEETSSLASHSNNQQASNHHDDIFSDTELSCIYEAFQRVDQHNTGTIVCGQLTEVLDLLGIRVDPPWLMQFLAGIEAGPETPMTFAELVDITAIVLGE